MLEPSDCVTISMTSPHFYEALILGDRAACISILLRSSEDGVLKNRVVTFKIEDLLSAIKKVHSL